MILISHRGNIDVSNPEMENDPRYIENTLGKGFMMLRLMCGVMIRHFFGHDKPNHSYVKCS